MASSVQSEQGGARVRIPPPLVFLAFLFAGVGLRFVVPPPPLPFARPVQIVVGAVLAVTGVTLAVLARRLFVASGQDPKPWMPSPSLVVRGPYRFTRNPMYVGLFLLTVGLGFTHGNLWVVIAAPLMLMVVHYIAVLPEEAYLEEKFGEDYRRFKRQVRRYL